MRAQPKAQPRAGQKKATAQTKHWTHWTNQATKLLNNQANKARSMLPPWGILWPLSYLQQPRTRSDYQFSSQCQYFRTANQKLLIGKNISGEAIGEKLPLESRRPKGATGGKPLTTNQTIGHK